MAPPKENEQGLPQAGGNSSSRDAEPATTETTETPVTSTEPAIEAEANVPEEATAPSPSEGQQDNNTDLNDDDTDSALGDVPFRDSLTSLRSSIMAYQHENGRTYHAMSAGKYFLPNDEQEIERLDLQHHVLTLTIEGNHCLCPKNDGAKRVLDLGTGTGILEQNHVTRQDKGGRDDESGRKKNQKEISPSRERIDRLDKEKYEKGRYEKGRHETDKRDKDRSKNERPDKGWFEKERTATSPPSMRMEFGKDQDSDHFQEQGSLPINVPESFGRVYERGPGNREDLVRGHHIGSNDLGQEFVRGYQGVPPNNVDEGYSMGYRRISGAVDDALGRGMHRGVSEDYGRGLQLGRPGNVEEEYAAGEISRGIHRNFPGSLGSEYSGSPTDLQVLQSGGRVYSRQGQHDFDSERPRLSQDDRGSEWLMGDTAERGRYYIDQGSRVNNIYSRNLDLVPDMPRSLLLGQQHEDSPQLHSRLPYHSDAYERTGLASSAMDRYAPRLDQQMNYTRSSLHQSDQAPRNIYGAGSQNFPFDSRGIAPGRQNPYPHQSSSGWIDD